MKNIPNVSSFTNFVDFIAVRKQTVKDEANSTKYREVACSRVIYFNPKGELIYPEITLGYPNHNYLDLQNPPWKTH